MVMIPGPALEVGIRTEFMDAYNTAISDQALITRAVREIGGLGRRVQRFAIPEAFSRPYRWDTDSDIAEDAVRYFASQFVVHNWGIKVEYREDDKDDDQTGTLLATARKAGAGFPYLKERGLLQFVRAGTDPTLFPAVPNAADGVPLFSATDVDGANRFGIVGGNIEPGQGPTPDAIRETYMLALARFHNMRNTRGDRNNDPANLKRFLILYGTHLQPAVWRAFYQERPGVAVALGGASAISGGAIGAAAASNIIQNIDLVPQMVASPYLSDTNDMAVLAIDVPKSIASCTRRDVRELAATMANSDYARKTRRESIQFDFRWGLGIPGIPFDWVQIDNTTSGVF